MLRPAGGSVCGQRAPRPTAPASLPPRDGTEQRVRKVQVRDGQGTRWTVRARRLRSTERAGPMFPPEQESLRRRVTRALAPHAAVAIDPLPGIPAAWRLPGDTSD